jgi:hypothetical protein
MNACTTCGGAIRSLGTDRESARVLGRCRQCHALYWFDNPDYESEESH